MRQCIVCGVWVQADVMRDHRDATHPDVKKSIPLTELFREGDPDAG